VFQKWEISERCLWQQFALLKTSLLLLRGNLDFLSFETAWPDPSSYLSNRAAAVLGSEVSDE